MAVEGRDASAEGHELRALLVRFLIEATPGEPRFNQVIAAMEQVVKLARDGQDASGLKAQIDRLCQALERLPKPAQTFEQLLAASDKQLAAQLDTAARRTQSEIEKLGTQVGALADRLSVLEAQVRKLSAAT